jgi:hypothetical protein
LSDRIGQSAIQSRSVSGTRQTAPPAEVTPDIKWHPGHYVLIAALSNVDSLETTLERMEEVAALDSVVGVMVAAYLGFFEGAKNDYSMGYARVDQLLSRAKELGLRLMIAVWKAATTNGTITDNTTTLGRFPPYTASEGVLLRNTTNNYITLALWTEAGMDRYIAVHEALALRYDREPYIEAIITGEVSTQTNITGYSNEGATTQWIRFCDRQALAWTHTNKIVEFNSAFGSDTNRVRFFVEGLVDNAMMLGDPDVRPDYFPSAYSTNPAENNFGTFAQRIYQGLLGSAAYPAHDYRGEIGCAPEIQGPNLGGNHTPDTFPNTELLDFIYDIIKPSGYLKVHYAIWTYKTQIYNTGGDPGTDDVAWNNASYPKIKDWLNQDPVTDIPLETDPPSLYGGNVDTS